MATKSKQPRFTAEPADVYTATLQWIETAGQDEPKYNPNTKRRDKWLSSFWHLEPHLAGVLHSLISIDSNRGWSLEGGRNQVLRYSRVLHDWRGAPGLYGWRGGAAQLALSYYTADLGGIVELGRDGKNGPLRQLYSVDPTACRTTGSNDLPLAYTPVASTGKALDREQRWRDMDYIRVVSMPSILEKYNGVGYCFESRALELAKLMVAVYQHDQEQLGARAPRGLLLLMGISETQWDEAMRGRQIKDDAMGYQYYGSVAVLATEGIDSIDAKLIALSQLPANFDLQKFTSLLMYGYALCAGYDPSEFYPVQFGSLGRGTEMEVQHQKATGKGGLNFALTLQEQLQRPDVLPASLGFEFEQRDDQGDMLAAQAQKSWAELVKTLRETGESQGEGSISREESRYLLADKGIIPREWSETETDVEVEDTDDADEEVADQQDVQDIAEPAPVMQGRVRRLRRDELLSKPHILRAVELAPGDALVRYTWNGAKRQESVKTLWRSGADLLRPMIWRLQPVRRQDDDLYSSSAVTITEQDVTAAINEGRRNVGEEFAELLDNEPWEENRGLG